MRISGEDELKMIMKIAVSSSRYGQSSSKDAHRIIERMRALYLSPDLETFILAMQVILRQGNVRPI